MSNVKVFYTNLIGFIFGSAAFVGLVYGLAYLLGRLDGVSGLFVTDTGLVAKHIIDIIVISGASSYVGYVICDMISAESKNRASPGVIVLGACYIFICIVILFSPGFLPLARLPRVFNGSSYGHYLTGVVGLLAVGDGLPRRKKHSEPQ